MTTNETAGPDVPILQALGWPPRTRKARIGWATLAFAVGAGLLQHVSPAGVLCAIAFWLFLPYWVYLDAGHRGNPKAWAFGLLCLLTNVFGLVVYLLVRPEGDHNCTVCGALLRPEFRVCPYCGSGPLGKCTACGQHLRTGWSFCPSCAAPVQSPEKNVTTTPPAPSAPPTPPPPPPPAPPAATD
jgi:hypothetical protein